MGRFILAIYRPLSSFFYHSGFFNTIYNRCFNQLFFLSYSAFTKLLDKGLLELFGPVGLYRLVAGSSELLRKWPNYVFFQIGSMFFSLLLWLIALCTFTFLSKGLLLLLVVVLIAELLR